VIESSSTPATQLADWSEASQPIHIEATVATAFGAVQGTTLGGLMRTFASEGEAAGLSVLQETPRLDRMALASFEQPQVSSSSYGSPHATDLEGDINFG
jgi:hypothetical protein